MKNFWLNRYKKRQVSNERSVIIRQMLDHLRRTLAKPKRCGCTKQTTFAFHASDVNGSIPIGHFYPGGYKTGA